jgi:hypothetical protein
MTGSMGITICGMTVSESVTVAVCGGVPESVTLKVSDVAVTAAEGVPPIAPVAGFNVKPAGSFPPTNCQL